MVSHIFFFLFHRCLPIKRKTRISHSNSSYLPDECWECIFKFIINHYENNNNNCNLNSLSLVSNQFLSITNRLRFSLTIKQATLPFLPRLFERFTNLNTIDLTHLHGDFFLDLDELLQQISIFPLKLTSLKLPYRCIFPVNGLLAFSKNITSLTSLTCSDFLQGYDDLSLIADCFPLLKQLNLSLPSVTNPTNFINGIHSLLSKSQFLQHLDLSNTYDLNDQHVYELSLFLGNLVSINVSDCHNLTESALFSLVRNCPSLSNIKMKHIYIGIESVYNYNSLVEFGVYPQLKSLYLGHNSRLRDEHIIIFSSMFPNLELLDLDSCNCISEGICQVLRRCCKLRYLNLAFCSKVKLHGINFIVPKLEVLNLSYTKVDDDTLYLISKNCYGLSELLLKYCYRITNKGVNHVVENCKQLRKISFGDFPISDKNRELFSRHGFLLR